MRLFYTDGSYGKNNIKAGGWACLEVIDNKIHSEKYSADFSLDCTSNRMELKAAIEVLKMVKDNQEVTIVSDSDYVVKGMTEWIKGWIKNYWLTSKKKPVINKDLWLELLELSKNKSITWKWIRSHSNDEFNNRADELSRMCYMNPDSIAKQIFQQVSLINKPKIGDIVYFNDSSKRYIVIMNDITCNNQIGFMARLLANHLGQELDFFSYNFTPLNIVQNKTETEKNIVFQSITRFTNKIKEDFSAFKKSCHHKIIQKNESAVCKICDKDFGWFCPESPDHSCHYFSNKGKITLNTGKIVDAPIEHDYNYEDYDTCIFCKDPEERK